VTASLTAVRMSPSLVRATVRAARRSGDGAARQRLVRALRREIQLYVVAVFHTLASLPAVIWIIRSMPEASITRSGCPAARSHQRPPAGLPETAAEFEHEGDAAAVHELQMAEVEHARARQVALDQPVDARHGLFGLMVIQLSVEIDRQPTLPVFGKDLHGMSSFPVLENSINDRAGKIRRKKKRPRPRRGKNTPVPACNFKKLCYNRTIFCQYGQCGTARRSVDRQSMVRDIMTRSSRS
jgi:hypothetical protein